MNANTDSAAPPPVLVNAELQDRLSACYEIFVSVTAAPGEAEYVERASRLGAALRDLQNAIRARAPAQARCQLLLETEHVRNHRRDLLARIEGAMEGAAEHLHTVSALSARPDGSTECVETSPSALQRRSLVSDD